MAWPLMGGKGGFHKPITKAKIEKRDQIREWSKAGLHVLLLKMGRSDMEKWRNEGFCVGFGSYITWLVRILT
jgi:hypothetical protein